MFLFKIEKARKRRVEADLSRVARIDAGHQRLDDPLESLAPETPREKRRERLVPVAAAGRQHQIQPHARDAGPGN